MSDYLRFITLYKFGGIYFDLDFIVIKNGDKLPPNFAPEESTEIEFINASVLGFESKDVGHRMAEMVLRFVLNRFVHIEISIKFVFMFVFLWSVESVSSITIHNRGKTMGRELFGVQPKGYAKEIKRWI